MSRFKNSKFQNIDYRFVVAISLLILVLKAIR